MLKADRRGQVFPIYVIGSLLVLMLGAVVLDYGSMLRWQIRAQNAADAAAQAAVSVQDNAYNRTEVVLYGTSVEEFRIRYYLQMMSIFLAQNGGCKSAGTRLAVPNGNGCYDDFTATFRAYIKAVNRYLSDVSLLHKVTYRQTFAAQQSSAAGLIAVMSVAPTCDTRAGLDCAFGYNLGPNWYSLRNDSSMHSVVMTSSTVSRTAVVPTINRDLAPIQAEVTTCRLYRPLLTRLFHLDFAPYRIVARAAAMSVPVNSEWAQPGTLINNDPSNAVKLPFQPVETLRGVKPSADGANRYYDWYTVSYGGAPWFANAVTGTYTIAQSPQAGEFDRYLTWWAPLPTHPSSAVVDPASLGKCV